MKKSTKLTLTAAAALLFGSLSANAVPAMPGLISVTAADGSQMQVRLVGDENFHQYYTEDGYPLLERNGLFYYCDVDAAGNVKNSGILATGKHSRSARANAFLSNVNIDKVQEGVKSLSNRAPSKFRKAVGPASASGSVQRRAKAADAPGEVTAPPFDLGYGLFPPSKGSQFPSYGTQKVLIVLVEYKDVKFRTSYDGPDYFRRMLTEEGFNDYGATGSASDYFRECSMGAFTPEFDVYGPITLSQNMSYYGSNDGWGNDVRPEEMAIEACRQLDDTVDFSEYDRDGDGFIDNIYIFYAGSGEATGGGSNTVWPHAYNVTYAQPNKEYIFDGVQLDRYACSNEWMTGRPAGAGTFIHEFSHVMGLPDLYTTDYSNCFTPGSYSALDYGPYNNDGMSPPLYGAFERYALGWIRPSEVTMPVSATLKPIRENQCGIIRTSKPTEFFLLENRQQQSWDQYIPGHGMLVWHIDYNEEVWLANSVNNSTTHQYVDIEEADGTQSEYSRDGDTFPGVDNIMEFSAETRPSMKTWSGKALDYPITEIEETADGLIKFDVLGGGTNNVAATSGLKADDIKALQFTVSWDAPANFDSNIYVYTKNAAGDPVYLSGYHGRNVGQVSSYTVAGVQPLTTYFVKVCATNGWEEGEMTDEISVTTGRCHIDYYPVVAEEAENIKDNSFDAVWNPLDEAVSYNITVYEETPGDPLHDICDFNSGFPLPTGWTSNSKATYNVDTYSGMAAPSLRLSNDGEYVQTPDYADGVSGFSFWHRGNGTSKNDEFVVEAKVNGEWIEILRDDIVTKKGGEVVKVEIPEGTTSARVSFNRESVSGSLAIDDVEVAYGHEVLPKALEAYNNRSVGDVLRTTVENLKPGTGYQYVVTATDGTYVSKPSQTIYLRTGGGAGVVAVAADSSLAIRFIGDIVTIPTDDLIQLVDMAGCVVASGRGSVVIPNKGFYIVSVPVKKATAKVAR